MRRIFSFAVLPSAIGAAVLLGNLLLGNVSFVGQRAAAQSPAPAATAIPQIFDSAAGEELTRGPLHEAFAVPIDYNPTAVVVVPQQPPADIEEVPPEVRPDDPNVIWISGYWNWDDERGDFIWISGLWRVPPPGRQWVPGYWTQVEGGFQRVAGFWAPLEAAEVAYYQAPPASLEAGPNSPPPSPEYFWVPGQWLWQDGRYVWQPGYWARPEPNWSWVPAYYNWTPGGYVYTSGYWDYPPVNRCMMFAPVYFQPAYRRPAFVYVPRVVLRVEILLAHLFARPSCRSYYFGDYYGSGYAQRGYYPWFASGRSNRWYDPIYAYHQGNYGGRDPNWSNRYREQFDRFTADPDSRPRHTFAEQQQWAARRPEFSDRGNLFLASSISDSLKDKSFQDRVKQLSNDERQSFQRRSNDLEQFVKQRRDLELRAKSDIDARGGSRPDFRGPTLKLPTSELTGRPNTGIRTDIRTGDRDGSRPSSVAERPGPGFGRGFLPTDDLRIVPDGDRPRVVPPQVNTKPTDDLRIVPDGDRPRVVPPQIRTPSDSRPSFNRPQIQLPGRTDNSQSQQPKITLPKNDGPRSDGPKIELPRNDGPKFTLPRPESRPPQSTGDKPRMNFGGGNDRQPTFTAPNLRIDRGPRPDNSPKFDAPKIQTPKSEPPRIERPSFKPPSNDRTPRESRGSDNRSSGNSSKGKKEKDK